jgi:hypothetical protein
MHTQDNLKNNDTEHFRVNVIGAKPDLAILQLILAHDTRNLFDANFLGKALIKRLKNFL